MLITAILGCLTAKFKNVYVAVPFGAMAFVFGMLGLMAGMLSIFFRSILDVESLKEHACKSSVPIIPPYAIAVNKLMCSDVCPCDPGEDNSNKKLWMESQIDVN